MSLLKPAIRKGKIYQNPIPTRNLSGNFFGVLWKYMTAKEEREPRKKPGPFRTDTAIYQTQPSTGLRVTWTGHSSLLIEIDGKRLLTDPVWSERASFAGWMGPKRFFDPPFALSELPTLDAIIISHDHYDHFDEAAIRQLANIETPVYTSLGVGQYLKKWGIAAERITELNWTDEAIVDSTLRITALPARHFSGRGLHNRNQTLWSSFIIKTDKHNIYFGADSGWWPGFKEIGDKYGPFDLTMLEIGAYNENWADIHMGPENAVKAHMALGGKVMLPIHWGTFNLALHAWTEPVEWLLRLAEKEQVTLMLPEPGKPTEVPYVTYNSEWWRR